jgi:hypothetical protein
VLAIKMLTDRPTDQLGAPVALSPAVVHDEPTPQVAPAPAPATKSSLFDDEPAAPPPAAKIYATTATKEEVKAVLIRYIETFGEPAAVEDCQKLMTEAVGAPVESFSKLPDNPMIRAAVLAAVDRALDSNRFGRPFINAKAA